MNVIGQTIVTFFVSRRRREMYCGHPRLCVSVCLCVCVSVCPRPYAYRGTSLHGPGCNLGEWLGMSLVVHYWADLH